MPPVLCFRFQISSKIWKNVADLNFSKSTDGFTSMSTSLCISYKKKSVESKDDLWQLLWKNIFLVLDFLLFYLNEWLKKTEGSMTILQKKKNPNKTKNTKIFTPPGAFKRILQSYLLFLLYFKQKNFHA